MRRLIFRGFNRAGVVFNLVGMVAILLFAAYTKLLVPAAASLNVAELDRAGAISEEQLRVYDPLLAEDPRYGLARFITHDHERALSVSVVAGLLIVGVNGALFAAGAIARPRS